MNFNKFERRSMKRGIPKPKTKTKLRQTTRLTYTPSKPGFLESSPFLLGSELCVVEIDKVNKLYRVLDLREKRICYTLGNGKNVDDCKKNARNKLVEVGACIFDEVRTKK